MDTRKKKSNEVFFRDRPPISKKAIEASEGVPDDKENSNLHETTPPLPANIIVDPSKGYPRNAKLPKGPFLLEQRDLKDFINEPRFAIPEPQVTIKQLKKK